MLLIRAGIAGQESKRTSERVIMALRKAAEKGKLVSKLPFGYVKVRDVEGERVEQVPGEAAAIRLAYELATARNMGYKGMADELNRLGYRTKSGGLFAAQSLKLILLNPAMAGHAVFRGQGEEIITENAYPAILNGRRIEPPGLSHQVRGIIRRPIVEANPLEPGDGRARGVPGAGGGNHYSRRFPPMVAATLPTLSACLTSISAMACG